MRFFFRGNHYKYNIIYMTQMYLNLKTRNEEKSNIYPFYIYFKAWNVENFHHLWRNLN